jgi:phosphate-selective porin O/P
MKRMALFLCLTGTIPGFMNGQDRDQRIADLERQLTEAKGSVAALQKTIESLSSEVQALHQPEPKSAGAAPVAKEGGGEKTDAGQDFTARIIGAENGSNEHDNELNAKPEIFIQTRYSVAPIDGSGTAFDPNLRLSRIETRWAGKINERLGAGLEIQFQESVEGSPEKLVNDAFLEYYLTDHATVRVGQFIKPFGFDVQQSSWLRESPERPIFSGYFLANAIGELCFPAISASCPPPPSRIFNISWGRSTAIAFLTTAIAR